MIIEELTPSSEYLYIKGIASLKKALASAFPDAQIDREFLITEPPESIDADLSYPLFREKSKEKKYEEFAEEVKSILSNELKIETEASIASGYLNIKFNRPMYIREFLNEYMKFGSSYGRHGKKLKILVEHTSANPVHPLHLGHGRNSCLGDTLARLLRFYGTDVETRFYIDDVGRQVAVLIYGLSSLIEDNMERIEELSKGIKIDHWIGKVYAMTNLLIELNAVKKELKAADDEKYRELLARQDEILSELIRLREEAQEIFDILSSKILSDEDPESKIAKISLEYERGDRAVVEKYRAIVEKVLEGFKQTLSKMNISFDKWDWESDLIWDGSVDEILKKARNSSLFSLAKGSEGLDFSPILTDDIRNLLKIPREMEIPPLVLKRSDGTTLYTTRDIAYSIKKFRESKADYVINVVGKEQMLPQAQIRLALYALGYQDYARRLIHYSYEMVNLQGFKMSGRRGRYVTLDELLQRAEEIASLELKKRNREMSEEEAKKISMMVGRGAIRHFMVSISADKPMTIRLEDMINFEKNSGPYLQYTYARASSLLRRAGKFEVSSGANCQEIELLTWKLVRKASAFPYIIYKSSKELKPELLVSYLGELSQLFNKWYDSVPVLGDEEKSCQDMKLNIVSAVRTVLLNSLNILGIEAPERI